MKKIILGIIVAFTLIITMQGVHAVDNVVLLQTKINGNDIRFGNANKNINQVLTDNYSPTDDITYIIIIPNETTASVLYDVYYYDVKTITIYYTLDYAVIGLFGVTNNHINEIYMYLPNIAQNPLTLIPNQSTYDNGYQQGIKDGFDNGANSARSLWGIQVNGQWLTAVEYAQRQVGIAIDNTIMEWGIQIDGILYKASQYGDMRYQQGLNDNTNNTALGTMFGGLASLFGVGLAFILQLGSIELMGISLNMILGIGLLLVGLIAILGLIFGGK